jgi:hypothetical protein
MLLLSMSASEEVAERALLIMDWIRAHVTSICPLASEVLNTLIDVRLEADLEATCFALAAMGSCVQRQDPDGALYLYLKSDDAREQLEKEKRQCPRGRPPGARPPEMGTPATAMGIVNTKREKLIECLLQAKKKKKEEEEQEASRPAPPRRRPTWLFDGTKIVGAKEPTEETPQTGDPTELQFRMKWMLLNKDK